MRAPCAIALCLVFALAGCASSGPHVPSDFELAQGWPPYTRALADRVGRALASQGIALDPAAPRSLEIGVVYARIPPSIGSMHCVIDYTVRAGDGTVHGLQARASSIDTERSCNSALSEAAATCLRDPNVLAYLAAPASAP